MSRRNKGAPFRAGNAPLVLIPKHRQELNEHNQRRALQQTVSGEEAHRINCPYCFPIGAAITTVRRKNDSVELPIGQILQCDHCKKHFKISVQLKMYGKPLEVP